MSGETGIKCSPAQIQHLAAWNQDKRSRTRFAARSVHRPKPPEGPAVAFWDEQRAASAWEKLRADIAAARPDLSESAAHTCARDIEEGRSTFEEVASGQPVTEDSIQTVLALHRAWKEAEAAFHQGVKDLSRSSGRS